VTSWKDEHGDELLFVSNKVLFFCLIVFQQYFSYSNFLGSKLIELLELKFHLWHDYFFFDYD
jgi:hypothetical protein